MLSYASSRLLVSGQTVKKCKGGVLPQRVFCRKCSTLLYEGGELKPPDEIIQMHNGKCPNCGKKLSLIPHDVEVRSIGSF